MKYGCQFYANPIWKDETKLVEMRVHKFNLWVLIVIFCKKKFENFSANKFTMLEKKTLLSNSQTAKSVHYRSKFH